MKMPGRNEGAAATPQALPLALAAADSMVGRRRPGDLRWRYEDGLALHALAEAGAVAGRSDLVEYVAEALGRLVHADGRIEGYRREDWNLDQVMPGRLLFAQRDGTGEARWGAAIRGLSAQLSDQPRSHSGALWHKGIYPDQLWLDGLYMASPFRLRLALETGDEASVDDVLLQFRLAEEHCRIEPPGLLRHAWNETAGEAWAEAGTGRSPNFWSRAMGWYALALADCLALLPPRHRGRAELAPRLSRLARAVMDAADPDTGLWWQVTDRPGAPGNYLETSASAMFACALAKGTRLGLFDPSGTGLDALAATAARRAFSSLVSRCVSNAPDGLFSLGSICQVAGLGGKPYRDGSYQYYISEPVVADDYKGVAPFVLAGLELAALDRVASGAAAPGAGEAR